MITVRHHESYPHDRTTSMIKVEILPKTPCQLRRIFNDAEGVEISTVVPCYNDHLYNGNFDFRRNFFGNGSFLMKIYYIITEFALSDTDSRRRNVFFYTFF